jgi:CDP-glucose 4,6-dehydratase
VLERLSELWRGELRWELDDAAHPPEASHLALDSGAAEARLGWTPRWNLEQALEMVVAWHDAERRREDMRAVTLAQIQEFVAPGS